jgi:hypothetical protein
MPPTTDSNGRLRYRSYTRAHPAAESHTPRSSSYSGLDPIPPWLRLVMMCLQHPLTPHVATTALLATACLLGMHVQVCVLPEVALPV